MSMAFKFMEKLPVKETDIQLEILHWLKKEGIFAWRNNSVGVWDSSLKMYRKPSGVGALAGVSDILGLVGNQFLAIEVKKPKGKVSEEQKAFLDRVVSEGHIGFVAYSLQDVIDKFKELKII